MKLTIKIYFIYNIIYMLINNIYIKKGQINEDETIYEMYNNSLNNYENIFNTIRQMTGIEDINEFVSTFNDIEDKNFSLFNYVSEISNEIEYSENEIQTLKEKIELLKKEEEENQEEKQKKIKQMEVKINKKIYGFLLFDNITIKYNIVIFSS